MKLILSLSGASGCEAFAELHALRRSLSPTSDSGLTPLPMNSTAKRFGTRRTTVRAAASAPQTGIDSSHGSAIATPAPRRKVRRRDSRAALIRCELRSIRALHSSATLLRRARRGQKLRAGRRSSRPALSKSIARAPRVPAHLASRSGSSESMQAAAQRIGQQFAAEVVDEIVLPMLADIRAQAVQTGPFAAVRETSRAVSTGRPPRSWSRAFADRAEAFEHQAEGIEPLVAAGAGLVLRDAAPASRAASGRRASLSSVGSTGTFGGGGGMRFAEQALHDPVAALHGTGSQPGRVLGQEHRHRQQAAAADTCCASSTRTHAFGPPPAHGIP